MVEEQSFFENVREQLRHWPYTIHQIDETLDIELIEGRAKQLLFQAINSNSLTAFVGSGLSANYGRLSWRDWEQEQVRVVENISKHFLELSKHSQVLLTQFKCLLDPDHEPKFSEPTWRECRFAIFTGPNRLKQSDRHNCWRWIRSRLRAVEHARERIRKLSQTFQLARDGDGEFPGGESLPIKFEIAQQMHDELRRFSLLYLVPERRSEDPSKTKYEDDEAWPGVRMANNNAAPMQALGMLKGKLGPIRNDERAISYYKSLIE